MIAEIRTLAGELGELRGGLGTEASDAHSYGFEIVQGLSEAAADTLRGDPVGVVPWVGWLLADSGHKVDDRVRCLLDSLERELVAGQDRGDG